MEPIQILVKIDDKEFKRVIKSLIQKGKNLRPPLKRSGLYMMTSFEKNFKTGGRPKRWPPLSPNTIAKRGESLPLMDHRRLQLSTIAKTGTGSLYHLRKDSLKMGSSLIYAAAQQYGTPPKTIIPVGKKFLKFTTELKGTVFARSVKHPGIPARPFVLFQKEDVKAITKIFSDYLME